MIWFLFVTAVFLIVINILINHNKKVRMMRAIPGPDESFLFGNTFDITVSPVELFNVGRRWAKQFNGIYRFVAPGIVSANIYNPEDIEIVLSTTKHNEKAQFYTILKPWLGDGLLLSKGKKWLHRRKILTPTFHFNILRQFCGIIEETSQRMVESLITNIDASSDVDVIPLVTEYTLTTTCETAMGTRLRDDDNPSKKYKTALHQLLNILINRFSRVLLYSDLVYAFTPGRWKQGKYLDIVHTFTRDVIDNRKAYLQTRPPDENPEADDANVDIGKKKRTAMLDLLIRAENEGLIDNAGIQEEVDTFMFEGHDTTAAALTFCLMLLANNQHCQEKLESELQDIFGDSKRSANIEDLSKMKYLECCIKESLRLYPPVFFIARKIEEETKLTDYTVPAGIVCSVHIYDLHRQENLYKNATSFDPDRFLPDNCIGRHPYAYIPFSAGPRNCIGQKFAMLVMKSGLSAILRKYKLLPVTRPEDISIAADVVLRTTHPVKVKFVARV